MAIDTKRAISAKFEREDGAIRGRRAISGVVGAYNTASRHATFLGGLDRYQLVWCAGASLVGYEARMSWVKSPVVGWATAKSVAAGCDAYHDKMTRLRPANCELCDQLLAICA